jgi:hypothetical protein
VEIEIASPLSRTGCIARLHELDRDEEGEARDYPADPAAWRLDVVIQGEQVVITSVLDEGEWQPFRRRLEGRVSDTPQGSSLRGRFRLRPAVRIMMRIWFVSMAAVVVLMAFGLAAVPANDRPSWLTVLVPASMLGAGLLLLRWGVGQSRRHEREIVEQLRLALKVPL